MVIADIIKFCIANKIIMRIIIIGEFSSFSKNLSMGFRALGHECFVFSWGDGFKNIEQDKGKSYSVHAQYDGSGFFSYISFIKHSFFEKMKLKAIVRKMSKEQRYDVALIINAGFISERHKIWSPFFTKKMVLSLVKNPNCIFLSACGSDVPYYDYWKDKNWKNASMIDFFSQYGEKKKIRHHYYVTSFANKIIPVMYGYAEAWRKSQYSQHCKVLKTIPLPVNTEDFVPKNVIKDKIVVFHGITRPIVKGTPFIKKALEELNEKYPELVECRAEGGMPLKDYLNLIDSTNIQIDQACCEYVGMNGLYGMAMGKVVLGGNEQENKNEFNQQECPIINIEPNHHQIYKALENLILNKALIRKLSDESRRYVEKVHDSSVVAQQYLDVFQKNI